MARRIGIVLLLVAAALLLWWGEGAHETPVAPRMSQPIVRPAPAPVPAAAKISPPAIELDEPVVVLPAPQSAPGSLEGTVIDAETDEGIASAELTFSHDDGAYATSTGSAGGFRFAPRAAGTYRLVSIEAKGYASFEREFGNSPVSFTSAPGQDVSGLVLRLKPEKKKLAVAFGSGPEHPRARRADDAAPDAGPPPSGSLRGRVFDARTHAPVAAFAIALWRREGLASSGMIAPASFVDASGAYEIDGLAPGRYEATAMAAGYASSSYAVAQIEGGAASADFALHAGARLTGQVTDAATRQPIEGATLALEGRRGETPDLPVAPLSPEAESGPDGRFTLEHVPRDALGLRADAEGHVTRLISLGPMPEEGDATPLAIALTPRSPGDNPRFELTGIGAVLQARPSAIAIQQVLPGGGAAAAGLVPGDEILSIDGAAVATLGFEGAMAAIRGPEGTTVALHVRRGGSESDVVVTRKLVRG